MLARVICCKCQKELEVVKVQEKGPETIILVQSCNDSKCLSDTRFTSEFDKHLCDIIRDVEKPEELPKKFFDKEDSNLT